MSDDKNVKPDTRAEAQQPADKAVEPAARPPAEEIGGPEGAEPTRFGDWEKAGRCSDF